MKTNFEKNYDILNKGLEFLNEKNQHLKDGNCHEIMSLVYEWLKKMPKEYVFDSLGYENTVIIGTLLNKVRNIEETYLDVTNPHILNINIPFTMESQIDKIVKAIKDGTAVYDAIKLNSSELKEGEEFLKFLVKEVRQNVLSENYLVTKDMNLGRIDFTNCCYQARKHTESICNKHGMTSKKIKIYPGFADYQELDNDLMRQHHASIVVINGEYYLVDTTYSQFFKKNKNNLDRLGVYGLSGAHVGSYMVIDKDRLNLAIKLINDGYVKLDKNVLKNYMDGFALSFRNGLFYENNNISSYTTPYTDDDYLKFLYTDDNQINYEGKENLGRQLKLLKNPLLDFNSFVK